MQQLKHAIVVGLAATGLFSIFMPLFGQGEEMTGILPLINFLIVAAVNYGFNIFNGRTATPGGSGSK